VLLLMEVKSQALREIRVTRKNDCDYPQGCSVKLFASLEKSLLKVGLVGELLTQTNCQVVDSIL